VFKLGKKQNPFLIFRSKTAQSSVEYLLMIAVISSIVFGLLAFSGRVEQIVANAKIGARDKLAGRYDLSPQDFSMGGLVLKDDEGAAGEDGEGGGGAGGRGGRGRDGARGRAGERGGLRGVSAPGDGDDADAAARGADAGPGLDSDYGGQRVAGGVEADQGYEARQADRRTRGRAEPEDARIRGLVTEEDEEDEDGSIVMRRQDGTVITKSKTLAERDWGIGKFLIILVVIIFVIIFVLKARQARD
jgi:hypothetical protein